MDPLLHNKIDELIELTKDNNKMLRKMRNSQMMHGVFRIVYWVLILAAAYGSWKYLGPSLKSMYGLYTNGIESMNSINATINQGGASSTLTDLKKLNSLLDQLKTQK